MVALVTTLVMATVKRRGALFLLRRAGTTTRQLLSMTIWQTVILDLTGLIIGAAAGAASVVVSKQLAGTWMPYLTGLPMAHDQRHRDRTDDPRDPGADPVAAHHPDPAGVTVPQRPRLPHKQPTPEGWPGSRGNGPGPHAAQRC